MKKMTSIAAAGFLILVTQISLGQSGASEKKNTGHCEKTEADGSTNDIEAKDKKECKAKGGKWNKAAKDNHDHK